jgi:hypothetical protein
MKHLLDHIIRGKLTIDYQLFDFCMRPVSVNNDTGKKFNRIDYEYCENLDYETYCMFRKIYEKHKQYMDTIVVKNDNHMKHIDEAIRKGEIVLIYGKSDIPVGINRIGSISHFDAIDYLRSMSKEYYDSLKKITRLSDLPDTASHKSIKSEKDIKIEILESNIQSQQKEIDRLKELVNHITKTNNLLHNRNIDNNKPPQTVEVKLTDSEAFKTLTEKLEELSQKLESETERCERILKERDSFRFKYESYEILNDKLKQEIESHKEANKTLREINAKVSPKIPDPCVNSGFKYLFCGEPKDIDFWYNAWKDLKDKNRKYIQIIALKDFEIRLLKMQVDSIPWYKRLFQ